MCAATVEEKVLQRQIFKTSLARAGTKSEIAFNYFKREELRDLFSLDESALDAPPATAAAMLSALMQSGAPRDPEADEVVAREAASLAALGRESVPSPSSSSLSSSSPSPSISSPSIFAGVNDHGRLYSVAGAGRVGEHRPPSPEREKKANNNASWPPGATPRPPAGGRGRGSPAATRGRGRGNASSYGGGGRRQRPPKPEDVAAGFLADVLGKAIGWGFNKIFSPKQQQQQMQPEAAASEAQQPRPSSSGAWPPPAFSSQPPAAVPAPPPQTEQELVSTIQRMDALLSDPSLRLPDGGDACRRKRAAAAAALEALRRNGGGGNSGGAFAPLQQHQQSQQQSAPSAGAAPSWGAAAAPAGAFTGQQQ